MDFLILAASAFWLGALHALEPGHGKAVVGAYLVGARSRPADAVLLGIVVTITHTGAVVLLAVLSAVAASYFMAETVERVLGIVSALLVTVVGGAMLIVNLRNARRRPATATAGDEPGQPHPHDHDDGHGHHHGPGHEHSQNGEHPHSHGLGSHQHLPELPPEQRPSFWQLLALGVSGGIMPCPSALAVLLASVSYGNYVQGIFLVLIHSLGLAATLVVLGLVVLKAASLAGRRLQEGRWARLVPVFSAALILLVGIGLTVRALLGPGHAH